MLRGKLHLYVNVCIVLEENTTHYYFHRNYPSHRINCHCGKKISNFAHLSIHFHIEHSEYLPSKAVTAKYFKCSQSGQSKCRFCNYECKIEFTFARQRLHLLHKHQDKLEENLIVEKNDICKYKHKKYIIRKDKIMKLA